MNPIYIFLMMLFLHTLDDFHLQGCLANLKQKSWWAEHAPDPMYKHDWIPALMAHCISWTTLTMLPCILFMSVPVWLAIVLFVFNAAFHFWIDDLKCNRMALNLIEDQLMHLSQLTLTFLVCWKIPAMFI